MLHWSCKELSAAQDYLHKNFVSTSCSSRKKHKSEKEFWALISSEYHESNLVAAATEAHWSI